MANTYAYIYQLQNESYQSLSNTDFKIAVTDPDDTGLTNSQISSLESSGKTLLSYLSIGEAENYRSYWQSSWNSNPPSFILGENPNWPGDYMVKFWDPSWQKLIIDKATAMAQAGYSGIVLDVVDVYTESSVAKAYTGPGDARSAMMQFVENIADAVHAVNPDFKIIQNNALDLLVTNPDDPSSATNSSYLSHIDGVNAETTFYMPDNSKTTWGPWNVQYLEHAVAAGKDVFAIDYPSGSSAQQSFISQALADGFIPFVGNQNLNSIPAINSQILSQLPADILDSITGALASSGGGDSGGTVTPPPGDVNLIVATHGSLTINGTGGNDEIHALSGSNIINSGAGSDVIYGGSGHDKFVFTPGGGSDVIHDFQGAGASGGDVIYISDQIFSSKSQIMGHVTYSGGNAVIQLDGSHQVTLLGVSHLITSDFKILADGGSGTAATGGSAVTLPSSGGTDTGSTGGALNVITADHSGVTITGTGGNDEIHALSGTNTINGGAGNDVIYGGSSCDIINVGSGNDDLYGGGGNDKFVFTRGGGSDVIHDFQGAGTSGGDVIYISSDIYSSKSQVMDHITYHGSDAVIQLDGTHQVTVLGVGDHGLSTVDFHIV